MRKIPRISILATLAFLIFSSLIYIFAWSSFFTVSAITVSGAPTTESKALIIQTAGITPGEKLARVEPRAVATTIESIEWVKSVDIARHWLSGHLEIDITPRIPIAYFNGSTIDSAGKVFILPGFSGGVLPTVSASHPTFAIAAVDLYQSLTPSFKSEVTSIWGHDASSFSLHLTVDGRDLRVVWGKNEETPLKIQVINSLLALEENKNIRRIDVSAPHAPIVK